MAGVPFDVVEKFATPKTTQAARELVAAQSEVSKTKADLERLLRSLKPKLPKEEFRFWRKAIRSGVLPTTTDAPASDFVDRWPKTDRIARAETRFQDVMASDVNLAR